MGGTCSQPAEPEHTDECALRTAPHREHAPSAAVHLPPGKLLEPIRSETTEQLASHEAWWEALSKGSRNRVWEQLKEVTPLPPAPTRPTAVGDLVQLSGVPGQPAIDGKGAKVLSLGTTNELELELEGEDRRRLWAPASSATLLPTFPEIGVSLAFLREFCVEHKDYLRDKSTNEVCDLIIKPLCASAQSSLAELVQRVERKSMCSQKPFTGKATLFVSHARQHNFLRLINALEAHILSLPESEGVFVWLDVFVMNQYKSADTPKPAIWWTEILREAIGSIGNSCLVLSSWDVLTPLSRTWCLWELACVAQTGATLNVALGSADSARFEQALREDFETTASSLSRIDIRHAQACLESDKKKILEVAESTVGLSKLNDQVLHLMRGWLVKAGKKALIKLPEQQRGTSRTLFYLARLLKQQGQLVESEALWRECVAARRREFGARNQRTLAATGCLAMVLRERGNLDEAESLYQANVTIEREMLGVRHPTTLVSMNNLASLLQDRGKLDDAEELQRETLEAKRDILGVRHPDTLTSMNNLAALLTAQGKLCQAEDLYHEAIKAQRLILGVRHRNTLISINNLAGLLKAQNRLEAAEDLYREVYTVKCGLFGRRHPQTLTAMSTLASLLHLEGKQDEAEELLREALEAQREVLGARHPHALASMNSLAMLLRVQGKLGEAEELYRESLEGRREVLGARHPHTLSSTTNLASVLEAESRLEEAELLYREALAARREVLGERDRQTLTSMAQLTSVLQAQGKLDEAEPVLHEAIGAMQEVLGARHPSTLAAMDHFTAMLKARGQRLVEVEEEPSS
eukprot:scaffold262834_cov31-Tisochrysis_lutea.AAC.1